MVVPLICGDTCQDPQWMHKIIADTESHIYYVFSYTYILMIKFDLLIRHSKRLAIITNNKLEQL